MFANSFFFFGFQLCITLYFYVLINTFIFDVCNFFYLELCDLCLVLNFVFDIENIGFSYTKL